jgi:pimeloyl-ACP methyl ester carboxylesterase
VLFGFNTRRVRTRALADAPAAVGAHPLVLFSPTGNPPLQYEALFAELASHGYVVAGLSHTYETIPVTAFVGGGVRLMSRKSVGGALSVGGKRPYWEDLRDRAAIVDVKADDLEFILGRLEAGESSLVGHVDVDRVAVVGHSLGGGAAVEVCRRRASVLAGATLDGGLWREPGAVGVTQAILLLFAEHPEYTLPCEEVVRRKLYATVEYCREDRETTVPAWEALYLRAQPGYALQIRGARHTSFTDWPLLQLWRFAPARRALAGSLGPGVWRTTADYLLAFLGRHLRGEPAPVLDGAKDDPRVVSGAPTDIFAARAAT